MSPVPPPVCHGPPARNRRHRLPGSRGTRDHIVRLLEEEANKENKTFILFPDKEQKGVFTGGYEVKFKIRGEDYSLLVDLRDFIEDPVKE